MTPWLTGNMNPGTNRLCLSVPPVNQENSQITGANRANQDYTQKHHNRQIKQNVNPVNKGDSHKPGAQKRAQSVHSAKSNHSKDNQRALPVAPVNL